MVGFSFTATASVAAGAVPKGLCTGTFKSKKLFIAGSVAGAAGRLAVSFGNAGSASAAAGVGAAFGPGYEECETTLICDGPEPCHCTN